MGDTERLEGAEKTTSQEDGWIGRRISANDNINPQSGLSLNWEDRCKQSHRRDLSNVKKRPG